MYDIAKGIQKSPAISSVSTNQDIPVHLLEICSKLATPPKVQSWSCILIYNLKEAGGVDASM